MERRRYYRRVDPVISRRLVEKYLNNSMADGRNMIQELLLSWISTTAQRRELLEILKCHELEVADANWDNLRAEIKVYSNEITC